jgi:hypothetical protein
MMTPMQHRTTDRRMRHREGIGFIAVEVFRRHDDSKQSPIRKAAPRREYCLHRYDLLSDAGGYASLLRTRSAA